MIPLNTCFFGGWLFWVYPGDVAMAIGSLCIYTFNMYGCDAL